MKSKDRDVLMRKKRRELVDRGFRPIRSLEDRGGLYCCVMGKFGDTFYFVAKEQKWDDEVSVLKKVVHRAADHDAYVLIYFDDVDEWWVLEAEYYRQNSREKKAKSKKFETTWLVTTTSDAVPMDPFLTQEEVPPKATTTTRTSLSSFESEGEDEEDEQLDEYADGMPETFGGGDGG